MNDLKPVTCNLQPVTSNLLSSRGLQLKDYYSILGLPASASGDEIKKAYRRLAHIYHPDKKDNDEYASAKFSEIKEAYETLINPAKRNYYLQQRWYLQSLGKKLTGETVTPFSILKRMLELDKYVSRLDAHRIHHEGLYNHICQVLSDENIQALNSFGDTAINAGIIQSALKSSHGLPYRFIDPVAERLKKLNVDDKQVITKIDHFVRHHQRMHYWEKKKVWIVLLIVLFICLAIFFSSR